jgi:hypothetical protein
MESLLRMLGASQLTEGTMTELTQPKNRIVRGIFGSAGSGKTYLASKMYGLESRAVCYNFMHDPQFTVRSTIILEGNEKEAERIWKVIRAHGKEPFRINFNPSDNIKDDPESFREVSHQVYHGYDLTFYIDELHMLTNASWSPEEFKRIAFMGRHHEISVTYIAQRFASVDKKITYQTRIFDFFQTDEPRDLQAIAERCGQDVSDRVKDLRRLDLTKRPIVTGEYYEYDTITRIGKAVRL